MQRRLLLIAAATLFALLTTLFIHKNQWLLAYVSTTSSTSLPSLDSPPGPARPAHPGQSIHTSTTSGPTSPSKHPIDELVAEADRTYQSLLAKRTKDVASAASAYRERRGRHPPPGFEKWVAYARENKALIIEDFFDQIYDDLEPFWGISPGKIKKQASTWPFVISIRNGTVDVAHSPLELIEGGLRHRADLLRHIQEHLPDVDLALSNSDQQPIVVPWEEVDNRLNAAKKTKHIRLPTEDFEIISQYSVLEPLPPATDSDRDRWGDLWRNYSSYWELVRRACSPDTPARQFSQDEDFSTLPDFSKNYSGGLYHGYVQNWTQAKSVCEHPNHANLHGALVGPDAEMRHTEFFPLFADSKIQGGNNVIVFPARNYWDFSDEMIESSYNEKSKDDPPWQRKRSMVFWRGQASGGHHDAENWIRFHRHRFVAMMNSTWIKFVGAARVTGEPITQEARPDTDDTESEFHPIVPPPIFPLPSDNVLMTTDVTEFTPQRLAHWLQSLADVAYTHFACNPGTGLAMMNEPSDCRYVEPYYHIEEKVPMIDMFSYKYLPDVDGYGFSGRFGAFIHSNSLPIKGTVFSEWLDSRLVPWRHFVPMRVGNEDLWGILEYFVGYEKNSLGNMGHDEVARRIATQGKNWARRTLRREDLLLYAWRLILEYARICDENRVHMGFVDDLI